MIYAQLPSFSQKQLFVDVGCARDGGGVVMGGGGESKKEIIGISLFSDHPLSLVVFSYTTGIGKYCRIM